MITLDTSGILAAVNRADPDHVRVSAALLADTGPRLVPAGILAELAYTMETTLSLDTLEAFLIDLDSGAYSLDCGEEDFPRIRRLVRRYADLRLGFADASVIACAERNGGRVLTVNLRDFSVVAREGTIAIVPEES